MSAAATGLRAALWIISLTLGILSLWSVLRQPLTAAEMAALCAFAAVSLVRPVEALLIFAAFTPILSVIGILLGFQFTGSRLLETFVLLLLVAWTARQVRWIPSARWRSLDWALLAFATIVATSAAAHVPILALRYGGDSAPHALWEYLTTRYLIHRPVEFDVVNEAMLLLEGVGLCAMVSRLALDSKNAERITAMAIAGAAGAAAMNIYRLFEVALRRGPLPDTLGEVFASVRINTQFGDLNAAGSYFSMAFIAAFGLSDLRSRRGLAFATTTVALGLAVWLSGSRTALASALLGVVVVLMFRHHARAWDMLRSRRPGIPVGRSTGRAPGLAATVGALALAAAAVAIVYPGARNVSVEYSVWARYELTETGLRMLADRPMLGVGVSRFYELFPHYASPELRQKFFESALTPVTRENAHNNFLQILAELGIAGFVAFLAVLYLTLRSDGPAAHPARLRSALKVAVGTFLLTALFGHPLLTYEVAYPFWIVLGVCAAGALDLPRPAAAKARQATAVLVIALIAIVPVRASYESREARLEGVALGMSNWRTDEAGNRFRWAERRSALFVETRAPVLTLPLKIPGDRSCTVQVSVDGRVVDRVVVPPDQWREVRLRLPPNATGRSCRIDLGVGDECAAGTNNQAEALMVGRPGELGGSSDPALPR